MVVFILLTYHSIFDDQEMTAAQIKFRFFQFFESLLIF